MLKDVDPNSKKIAAMLEKKSQLVLKKFRQVAISDIENPKVIAILEDVKAYWKDTHRPALTVYSCEAVGGKVSMANEAGLMITLTAAGMGIHDDIIDKSQNKHFRETILGLHGIDNALLVGDLLLIKGLLEMGKILRKSRSPNKNVAILEALKKYLFDIYEGEVTDITCRQNLETEVDDYAKTIWELTSDGEVCARIGAILGGGSNKEINALAEFGRRLSFIIHLEEEVRDSLNEEGSLPHRMEFESVPLPILYAAKSSSASFFEVKSIIQKEPIAPYVFDLTKICWKTKAITYVHNLAKQSAIEAAKRLESIKPSVARNALFQMIKAPLAYLENAHLEEVRYTEALAS